MHKRVPGKTQKALKHVKRGGFLPSIMGGFVANVESAIVPAVLYTLYHMFVPKIDQGSQNVKEKQKKQETRRNVTKKQKRTQ